MLFVNLILFFGCIALLVFAWPYGAVVIAPAVIGIIVSLFLWPGFFELEPNEARVMVFFGKYKGTFRETGFFWVNPFIAKKKLSLRSRNLDVKPIKVNDKAGNPIMIGLVLVWKLKETYKAMFEIDAQTMASGSGVNAGVQTVGSRMLAFENFVKIQSDAALRQVAGQFAYDDNEIDGDELTLRGGGDEINLRLVSELNNRLSMAGIEISEARINYLAYAPEIAAVMLRRQQATAVIAAREKIVEGAVSMVKMAIEKIKKEEIADFNKEDKVKMVSNLLVVLCADEAAQPVINTGD
jgi:regulator of protease activity HflC (stomatin/prohibitin superfamily)